MECLSEKNLHRQAGEESHCKRRSFVRKIERIPQDDRNYCFKGSLKINREEINV